MSSVVPIQSGSSFSGVSRAESPGQAASPASAAATTTGKPARLYVNPDYQFDPTLGLVVMEFHDASGNLTNSIPSQRQLDAYRTQMQTEATSKPPDGTPSVG